MVMGLDKRNPLFTIYRDAKQGKVYIQNSPYKVNSATDNRKQRINYHMSFK